MRHRTTAEKRLEKIDIANIQSSHNYDDSKPEHRDPKAYERFKSKPTNYGSGKKCSYGDKQKSCDPGCRFWESCVNGLHRDLWKGEIKGARSRAEDAIHSEE